MLPKDSIKLKEYKMKLSFLAKERLKNAKNNPNYKDGRTLKEYFCSCGKKLGSYKSKQCRSCATKKQLKNKNHLLLTDRKFENNSNYKHGKSFTVSFCLCGNKKTWTAKECRKCSLITISKHLKGRYIQSKNWNFIDGRTSLVRLIRNNQFYKEWRNKILKRDNYTCQECHQIGYKLEVNHKKSFREIFNEFLLKYCNLNPIENKEELLKLSFLYLPFWDDNNAETLCKACHIKTNNYGFKSKKC